MPSKQPQIVRSAVMLMIISAAFVIYEAIQIRQNVGSAETVNALGSGLFQSLGMSVTELQRMLTVIATVAAVVAAAAIVLAIFAGRGSSQARIGLVVLALPMLLFGQLIGLPFVVAVVLLFHRQAAPWFASGAVPTAYAPTVSSPIPPYPAPPVVPQFEVKRPGTVTAAAVITIVLSSISTLLGILGGIGVLAAKDNEDFHRRVLEELNRQNANMTYSDIVHLMEILGWVFIALGLLSVLGIVAGALTLRRSNAMRILTIVLAALTIAASVLLITSVVSLVWLVGSIVVIVFLAQRRASDWFNQR